MENGFILVTGKHEVQRGNSVSVRQFNQRFPVPQGIDISQMGTEVTMAGRLIISAPQLKNQEMEIVEKGEFESTSSAEAKKITSEAAFEVEGGKGSTKTVEDSKKKQEQKLTRRETEDGWEEEIIEEYEEEVTTTSSTTTVVSSDASGVKVIPMMIQGAAGGTQTVEMASSQQNIKAKDGKIIEMQKTSDKKTETKEMVIPIQIQGRPAIEQKVKTPRPRMLPFEFPSLPSLSMPSLDMPSMGMMDMGMQNFNMPMQSASDMMAQMQAQMQQQMASMQHATMQQMQMQMQSAGTMHQQKMEKQQAMSSVHQQSSIQQTQQQTMESAQEMMHQDFFVPLKQINKVNKNA